MVNTNTLESFFLFFKKYKYWFAISLVAVISGGYFFITSSTETEEQIKVVRGSIKNEILVSGKMESEGKIDFSFKNSGKIARVSAKEGVKVKKGDVLASLESSQVDAQINKAKANLDLQKAKYAQFVTGATVEDISVTESTLASAKTSLENSKNNVVVSIKDAFSKSDDVIRSKTDGLFLDPRSGSPVLNMITSNSLLEGKVVTQRMEIETILNNWSSSIAFLSTSNVSADDLVKAKNNLSKISSYFDNVAVLMNGQSSMPSGSMTQADFLAYKANVSDARGVVSDTLENLVEAENALNSNNSQVQISQKQLDLKKIAPREVDKDIYTAEIRQAEANYLEMVAQKEDLIIRSPINGTITFKDINIGENISGGKVVISMIPDTEFEITANISEANIGSLQVDQKVRIVFDAFPNSNYSGVIFHVDPTETSANGQIYYKSKISLEKNDPKLRAGFTANIWINLASKDNVLILPQSAVKEVSGKKYVTVIENEDRKDVTIETGISSTEGYVEIISGLTEGQVVLK